MKPPNNRTSNYKQGIFVPKYPKKYIGDKQKIIYRSSWENKLMKYLDLHPSVLSWNSEDFIIKYFYPVDGKYHNYHVDFIAKMKLKDGSVKTYAIEVKPEKECFPPKNSKNKARMITETETYIKNQSKWAAAKEYCSNNGIEFIVLTEKDLGIKT